MKLTNQKLKLKLKPCPFCGAADHLTVYKYDNGWLYVRCDNSECAVNPIYIDNVTGLEA